jgi:hypothetical protein
MTKTELANIISDINYRLAQLEVELDNISEALYDHDISDHDAPRYLGIALERLNKIDL